MTDVLAKVKCTREEVTAVVQESEKQRFAIVVIDGKEYIRANQGHSFPVPDLELKRISSVLDIPKGENGIEGVVVHGTYTQAWKIIKKKGLSRMNRNHIHFAIGTPGESHVISGMRSTCQVLIYVDIAKAIADGFDFFLSENHVVLTPGDSEGFLPSTYFRAVLDAETEKPFDLDFPGTL
jgi:2'-phosphotransferase